MGNNLFFDTRYFYERPMCSSTCRELRPLKNGSQFPTCGRTHRPLMEVPSGKKQTIPHTESEAHPYCRRGQRDS
jgi:hypothetical protein